ncbi:metabolite traffic protein EboE [Hyphomicrobium sp.]|uniref:metabolite traffic protein EboE n=1 Tax=Hyphomicrobium sp. TaxID=82 RepID=UPI002E312379|nr:metabolite traffic protein EboE [Hyphomicrobium sp.]HEX2841079.1 metabolite traffic protein EboE [Hyphomicrobium sp.]
MQLDLPGQPHLSYCTNIHAGETWGEIEAALASHLPAVKQRISPDRPMGIGLRLSGVAARELAEPGQVLRFRHFLAEGGFYVFTVNAFPYGSFHGQRVKEQVYEPDWRTPERLRFTNQVADLLARIAPENVDPTISTVPGAFKANVSTPSDVAAIAEGFARAAAHLHALQRDTGRTVVLAIEPEPACFLETTNEVISFLNEHLIVGEARQLFSNITGLALAEAEQALRRHVGLCFDVCHSAVEFEETVEMLKAVRAAGIAVAKIQLSSALRVSADAPEFERLLGKFDDGIYLHQTVERRNGALTHHTDLPAAFAAARSGNAGGEWRVHCHVPVFVESYGDLGSTQQQLRDALRLCRTQEVSPHLEVETYTWNVLPNALKSSDLVGDIVRELQWVRAELGA